MNAITAVALVFASVFVGAVAGMGVRRMLTRHDLNPDSKEVVKLAMGLIATLTALTLGLLVTNASSNFNAANHQIRLLKSNLTMLDGFLEQYGPEARTARVTLRKLLPAMSEKIWEEEIDVSSNLPFERAVEVEAFLKAIQSLNPRNDTQRFLRERIQNITGEIAQSRLQLHNQTGNLIRPPFLMVIIFWLAALFMGFGLLSRASPIMFGALAVCALSVSGAIFLLIELEQPFRGLMAISEDQLLRVLPPLR